MLDPGFMFLAPTGFGFSAQFVDRIRRLHEGTTARFLVNGELSSKREVRSGIRQGYPLALLLFIIAAETLALAIEQTPTLRGIATEGAEDRPHKVSAFVDDAAVFVQSGAEVKRLLLVLSKFGSLSCL